jgi:hypothetical protein
MQVNEAVNELLIDEEDFEGLRSSITTHDNFDQVITDAAAAGRYGKYAYLWHVIKLQPAARVTLYRLTAAAGPFGACCCTTGCLMFKQITAVFFSLTALQVGLASKLERHELLEFRRLAAFVYKKNLRWKKAVELAKADKCVAGNLHSFVFHVHCF